MLDKNDVKCLLFDLDDTLISTSWRVHPAFVFYACKHLHLQSQINAFAAFKGLIAAHRAKSHSATLKELNHDRFVRAFAAHSHLSVEQCDALFRDDLPQVLMQCKRFFAPIFAAQNFVQFMKSSLPLVLATNPVLNEPCARLRISWAGFDYADFAHVTHSQNTHYCKPSDAYYNELLAKLAEIGVSKDQCLFIGNDPKNDAAAIRSGITTILVNKKVRSGVFRVLAKATENRAALYEASWQTIAMHFGLRL